GPAACTGAASVAGVGGTVFFVRALAREAVAAVAGSGRVSRRSFGRLKSNAEVRSPQTLRRQGEMFGSITPKRCSRKRITEVWSKTWELTKPPRDQGETTYIGARGPRP